MIPTVRQAAVAGTFYPEDAHALRTAITAYLQASSPGDRVPKALIVPHAGYVYSGPVAASAYAWLQPAWQTITRVVMLGPAHWVRVKGLAASSATAFATPLGQVPVAQHAVASVLTLPQVQVDDEAHTPEHSLEVQLPFLQVLLETFTLVPLVVGETAPTQVAEVLDRLWGGLETCLIVSSDLSHYHDYATAQQLDRATSRAIETLRPHDMRQAQACGCVVIQGLLHVALQRGLHPKTLELRNSGDTAGPRHRVVGYGAYVFTE